MRTPARSTWPSIRRMRRPSTRCCGRRARGPGRTASWQGPNSGLFKSTDGGNTWQPAHRRAAHLRRKGSGASASAWRPAIPKRMYALVESREAGGVYRSDDAGEHLAARQQRAAHCGPRLRLRLRARRSQEQRRHLRRQHFHLPLDRRAARAFTAIKGAPGGDDYHTIWINPEQPRYHPAGRDQGATISVNGGADLEFLVQPAHRAVLPRDHRQPVPLLGLRRAAGERLGGRRQPRRRRRRSLSATGIPWAWKSMATSRPTRCIPTSFTAAKVTRFDRDHGRKCSTSVQLLRGGKYRLCAHHAAAVFAGGSACLYLGSNVLFKTTNGGRGWEVISPDLTREKYDIPPSVGVYTDDARKQATRRGVIYTIAPSHKNVNVIWAGTDDGLIHVTRDGGKTWNNVTPPELTPWSKVSMLDASHFDDATAYAAINRIRLDDLKPHIYRTHDGGKTLERNRHGLPDEPVNTVREDPVRKGLLFAGTELAVYVSFNDGDDWQPLRLNMPPTSIRDLVVHDDDLVAGTHGRGFWILDDIAPLRQLNAETAAAEAYLFHPPPALRVRWNNDTDTPLPPEEPAGQNPPDGAILYYTLKSAAPGAVTLEVFDGAKKLVRRYSSDDQPDPIDPSLNVPTYWIRPPEILSTSAGLHRFVWDLCYPPPEGVDHEYPISAIVHDTPRYPLGALALPGEYSVKLTVNGTSYSQPLTVKMDPRVKTSFAGLQRQFDLARRIIGLMQTAPKRKAELSALLGMVEGADVAPTPAMVSAVDNIEQNK